MAESNLLCFFFLFVLLCLSRGMGNFFLQRCYHFFSHFLRYLRDAAQLWRDEAACYGDYWSWLRGRVCGNTRNGRPDSFSWNKYGSKPSSYFIQAVFIYTRGAIFLFQNNISFDGINDVTIEGKNIFAIKEIFFIQKLHQKFFKYLSYPLKRIEEMKFEWMKEIEEGEEDSSKERSGTF